MMRGLAGHLLLTDTGEAGDFEIFTLFKLQCGQ